MELVSLKEEKVKYRPVTLQNFRSLPQLQRMSEEELFDIEVVGNVLPFRSNNFVVENMIDWSRVPDDPMFRLTFPQREMLKPHHFEQMAAALKKGNASQVAHQIRMELNPHPAGQLERNIPLFEGRRLQGVQHKYRETVLFFPSQGQTCHAFCSFCFRWPQFVLKDMRIAMSETDLLKRYIQSHPDVSDVLFTGGDPMVMRTDILKSYVQPLLDVENLRTIRLGTKALSYWPYRFLDEPDADNLLRLFEHIVASGKHLTIMAHFNHPVELQPEAVSKAVSRIRSTGAQIRTQSPLLAHINDSPELWAEMWARQVKLGLIPYYFFIVRDTGAQHYFGVPIVRAWEIFRNAYQKVSGICRTVRGPSMSTDPGKVHILGVVQVGSSKAIALQFIQARNPAWVRRPFLAEYDEEAIWFDELKPAFGEPFFFAQETAVA